MGVRFENVVVSCDSTCKACEHQCTALTIAKLEDGLIRVAIPPGWTQDGDTLLGPNCTEERALYKAMQADLPDPADDPEPLRETREARLDTMKEVVKADLEEREAEFPELRDFVRRIVLKDGDVPDFLGHVGPGKVEVRVRGDYVEISFGQNLGSWLKNGSDGQGMSLTLRHRDLEIENPPAFMDPQVLEWVQGCLRTMTPAEVSDDDGPVAQ